MIENIKTIQNVLDEVYQVYSTNKKLKLENADAFNLFSILNMQRKEVECHSYFIYELLNVKGRHNQNTKFLSLFLKDVLDIKDEVDLLNVKVYREEATENNQRIDFTIETSIHLIGIEMKIDAPDSKYQLWDYHQELSYKSEKLGKKPLLYYLTLNGKDASNKSLLSRKEAGNNLSSDQYKKLSFEKEILMWLKPCIEQVKTSTRVSEILLQYQAIVREITYIGDDYSMEIEALLNQDKEHFTAAHEIYKMFKSVSSKLESEFWEILVPKLKAIPNFLPEKGTHSYTDVQNARKVKSGAACEINIHFKLDYIKSPIENTCFYLQVGAANYEEGIYATVYKEVNGKWANPNKDNPFDKQLIELVRAEQFKNKVWYYGSKTIMETINLRNEDLIDAKYHIDELVEKIEKILMSLKERVSNELISKSV